MQQEFDYPFELRPLAEEEGGGWLISFPDLPGCIFDGGTPEEAIANGKDALAAWLQAVRETGREVPGPGELPSGSLLPEFRVVYMRALLLARGRKALA
jgi:antitoxin HicB